MVRAEKQEHRLAILQIIQVLVILAVLRICFLLHEQFQSGGFFFFFFSEVKHLLLKDLEH